MKELNVNRAEFVKSAASPGPPLARKSARMAAAAFSTDSGTMLSRMTNSTTSPAAKRQSGPGFPRAVPSRATATTFAPVRARMSSALMVWPMAGEAGTSVSFR